MPNGTVRSVALAVVVALLAPVAVCQDDQPPAPPIGELIAAIRAAENLSQAGQSYVAARNADKKNPEVYVAYIERLLTFGRPRLAFLPARELSQLDANSGLAHGVLGYCYAQHGKLAEALAATIRAGVAAPDNPGVLYNAGVLSAWLATDTPPEKLFPAEAKTLADRHLPTWRGNPAFAEGVKHAAVGYEVRGKKVQAAEAKVKECQRARQEALNQDVALTRTYESAKREMLFARRAVEGHRKSIQFYQRQASGASNPSIRADYQNKARLAEEELRRASARYNKAQRSIRTVEGAVKNRERKIKAAERDLDMAGKAVEGAKKTAPVFVWKPPAVKGVITPEGRSPVARKKPGPTSGPAKADPAAAAARRLKMARMLLKNDRRARAVQVLKEIIKAYPGTPPAKEAEKLLDSLF